MSSSNKTTSRGGKGANKDTEHAPGGEKTNKTHKKSDGKSDSGGGNTGKKGGKGSHQQASHHDNRNNQIDKSEDAEVKKKVHTVMEATLKNEEEVYLALVDCNYNMELAIEQLLEGNAQGEWNTFKKKKNRQTSTSKAETGGDVTANAATEDWDTPPSGPPAAGDRDRSRTRGGGPPRHRGRGGGRRENRESDRDDGGRNDGGFGGARRNRMQNGPPRGGGSGRGGRGGGRLGGPRSFQSRDGGRSGYNSRAPVVDTWDMDSVQQNTQPIDTWDSFPQPEDWDNEEYTGSLADTKVFTPSNANEAAETPGGGAVPPGAVPAGPQQQDSAIVSQEPPSVVQQLHNEVIAASVTPEIHPPPTAAQQLTQALELRASQPPPQVSPQQVSMPPAPQSTTLSAAQSQYLSQLTQQTSENMKAAAAAAAVSNAVQQSTYQSIPYSASAANSYNSSGYGATTNYTSAIQQEQPTVVQQQPTRTKTQRARVPPPSKIPASAVEMPGDLNTSIGFLDVQFGGLDLVSDNNSFESVTEVKYSNSSVLDSVPASTPTTNLDINSVNQSLDAYSNSSASKQQSTQSNLNAALVQAQSQILSNTEQTNDHLSSSVNSNYSSSRSSSSVQQQQQTSNTPQSVVSPIDVNKTAEVVAHSGYAQPTQPNSYHQTYQSQKTNSSPYQSTPAYSSTNYSGNVQVTSSSSYPSSQSTNSYSANSANNSSSAAVAAAAYNSSSNQQNSSAGNSSYQTSSYSTTSYQSTAPAFAAISQPAAFPTNNQYQTNPSQSVYAAAGLNNSSTYPTQYNSYNTASTNHKLGTASSNKDSQSYDSTGSAAVSSTGVVSSVTNAVSASVALTGLSNSQTNTSTTASKVTTTSAAKSGIVPNMPPGVAPMVGTQYIMGQAGMPFYQQPVYSYEDLQLLQQRIPHMTTGYYDMGYQTPTSLATGREGGLASVAYSMSDGRFTRADNNASPVPSTISQQTTTQAHQAQPMLNATLPPGYAYFYGAAGMMPGSFQYGTPAIYPQMPTATNAHGSTTSSQYPKPGSYGSGYGSGYDALSQSTQDYNKSAYVGANQTQNKTGVAVTTGSSVATDLTTAMYGKTHAALGKVNSYEKQGFHSGTPPPFNLAGNQSAGMAPSGTYAPHLFIPTMAPHHTQHNTLMQHQPLHQMDVRHAGRRTDSGNSTGQRTQTSSQAKPGAKQAYQNSYWNAA